MTCKACLLAQVLNLEPKKVRTFGPCRGHVQRALSVFVSFTLVKMASRPVAMLFILAKVGAPFCHPFLRQDPLRLF